ncbi:hypothetical protein MRB53_024031 [Persea americana]|uniref:Uncharacterized protein n=1 Tax=Persea americana TaxID=3435 RepID=A0ACC2LC14_PERAE|nr:hypothetical protein MRB53_024031 [Persea americana]
MGVLHVGSEWSGGRKKRGKAGKAGKERKQRKKDRNREGKEERKNGEKRERWSGLGVHRRWWWPAVMVLVANGDSGAPGRWGQNRTDLFFGGEGLRLPELALLEGEDDEDCDGEEEAVSELDGVAGRFAMADRDRYRARIQKPCNVTSMVSRCMRALVSPALSALRGQRN